jgi:TonB family protein
MATENAVAPAQPVAAGMSKIQARAVGQILALSARPVPPVGPLLIPEGTRKGEFIANPEGRPGATARLETTTGGRTAAGRLSGDGGGMTGVYVAPAPKSISGPVSLGAPQPPGPVLAPHSSDPASGKAEDTVFQGRKYYSLALNMPNLTSAGGSWIIRFAELNPQPGAESNLAAPVPTTKVDPAYPADLMHDRVEGVVVLYALIQSDGRVGEVRVLQGVEERLDSNAESAIKQWHFRPATKNDVPVAVEAVIRVPFRAPRATPY